MKSFLLLLFCCPFIITIKAQLLTTTTAVTVHQSLVTTNTVDTNYQPIKNIQWKFKTGGKIFSSPAINNSIAFIGSEDKNLYAIDIKTGRQKWKFATSGAVHSSPLVYLNTVYTGSYDGYYYAIDINTGQQKWKFKTGGEKHIGDTSYWGMKPAGVYMNDLWDCFLSSPIIEKSAALPTVYFGSSDSNVYALNATTGVLKWKFKTNGMVHASPTLYNGTIYIGSWDTYMYAIDATTGEEKWKFKTGSSFAMAGIQAAATVQNGLVYFGARDAHIYALNTDDGTLAWQYNTENAWVISTAVIKNNVLYVGTSDSYLLLALDIKTGEEKWRFKANGYVFGSPAIAGTTAYFGDFTGNLFAVNINDVAQGHKVFSTANRKQFSATVLKNDTLNFMYAAKDEDLYVYETNKMVMERFYSLGTIVSSPAISNDILYVGSADGYLYALQLRTKQKPSPLK